MNEETKEKKIEEKENLVETAKEPLQEQATQENKEANPEKKKEEKPVEKAAESKEETKKKKNEKPNVKKEDAVARGRNLHISKKQGMYICEFIKKKKIDSAIADLEDVMKKKKAVPFKGEIPHRKGPGMMSGRYPIKASSLFINILKALKGNVIVNGLDLDKTRIHLATSSWAVRPMRSGNRHAKRTNIVLVAKEFEGVKK